MRAVRIMILLAALVAAGCTAGHVSYDFSDLDERNLLKGEPD